MFPVHDGASDPVRLDAAVRSVCCRATERVGTVVHPMSPADQRFPRSVAVIPAWNEAETVGAVVYAALDARLVDEVVVVDNASTDATAAVAADHGARVVQEPTAGKGGGECTRG